MESTTTLNLSPLHQAVANALTPEERSSWLLHLVDRETLAEKIRGLDEAQMAELGRRLDRLELDTPITNLALTAFGPDGSIRDQHALDELCANVDGQP